MAETPRLRGTLFDKRDGPEQPAKPSELTGTLIRPRREDDSAGIAPEPKPSDHGQVDREPNPLHPDYERYVRHSDLAAVRAEDVDREVERQVDFLRRQVRPLKALYGSYAAVLGGDSPLHEPRWAHRLSSAPLKARFDYSRGGAPRPLSFHSHYFTGRDVTWLMERYPRERCKFYLALRLDTTDRQTAAKRFATELLTRCKVRHLSISTKSFDHNYDSFNIYTWDPDDMAALLRDLYVEYRETGIFESVPRFFQKPILGVPEGTIAYVREPAPNPTDGSARSHSVRMAVLGMYLDHAEKDVGDITVDAFREGCRIAGVRPEAPWEVTPPEDEDTNDTREIAVRDDLVA